ncbi:hypothetical protein PMAYCL1PPCAC_19609, partial [Pristionchus mayeri]
MDSDEESEPVTKKKKPLYVQKEILELSHRMETCLLTSYWRKLQYRTNCVRTWLTHLRYIHSTTPILAGFTLVCECGHECHLEKHSLKVRKIFIGVSGK